MSSWKYGELRHRLVTGQLVELRDNAERGLHVVYRIVFIGWSGSLTLQHVSPSDQPDVGTINIPARDAHEAVFTARRDVLDRFGL